MTMANGTAVLAPHLLLFAKRTVQGGKLTQLEALQLVFSLRTLDADADDVLHLMV